MSLAVFRNAEGFERRSEAPSRPSSEMERATRPDLLVLRQLAERLETSVQGSLKQDLVRRLLQTLADLSRTLQGPTEPSRSFVESDADASGLNSTAGAVVSRSPRWTRLLAQLAGTGVRSPPLIAVVDQDAAFRSAISQALEAEGLTVETFATCDLFLRARTSGGPACLIIDADLPGMNDLKLLRTLDNEGHALPVIVVAGHSDVQTAVDALKAGVVDFLEKPICCDVLLASVERALVRGRESQQLNFDHEDAANRLHGLTPRQRQVMDRILAGHPSKNIAADIGVSQRTVESHRAEVMRKMGVRSMPALVRLATAAAIGAAAPLSFHFAPACDQAEPMADAPANVGDRTELGPRRCRLSVVSEPASLGLYRPG